MSRRDSEEVPCSFFEDEHLDGQADMVAVIAALLAEEKRRRAEGRADAEIPMRPDHGQEILDDLKRGAQPGYPAIGRLKGLAELRGVMTALSHPTLGRLSQAYPDRMRVGAWPKACEKAREKDAADEKPVRAAISAIRTCVSTTSRRAALSRSLR